MEKEFEHRRQAINAAFDGRSNRDYHDLLKPYYVHYKQFSYSTWRSKDRFPHHLKHLRATANITSDINERFKKIFDDVDGVGKRFESNSTDRGFKIRATFKDPKNTPGCEHISGIRASMSTATDGEIDPITNRRVLKKTANESADNAPQDPTSIPVKTFKGYRSQFDTNDPPTEGSSGNTSQSAHTCIFLKKSNVKGDASENKKYNHEQPNDISKASENTFLDRNQKRLVNKGARLVMYTPTNTSSRLSNMDDSDSAVRRPRDYRFERDSRQDLDLLRARDSGASLGGVKQRAEKRPTRSELEKEFETKVPEAEYVRKPTGPVFKEVGGSMDSAKKSASSEVSKADRVEPQTSSSSSKLTGNFVRDFPEEFQQKWITAKDSSGLVSKSGGEQVGSAQARSSSWQSVHDVEDQQAHRRYVEGAAPAEDFGRSPGIARMETSLDRSVESNMTQKKPEESIGATSGLEGLEGMNGNEEDQALKGLTPQARKGEEMKLVQELRGIYEDAYGTIDSAHRQISSKEEDHTMHTSQANMQTEASSSGVASQSEQEATVSKESPTKRGTSKSGQEPAQYKILAYDPASDTIKTTEWASEVYDNDKPQTPAQVIAQLSYPAMFLSHFDALREEGFEIISGVDDVLVFRKVPLTANHEPTLYKVLVYDSDSDTMTTAKWVSTVNDEDKPKTPAQIMPDLSHPAKFLEYFDALREEDFEIISGVDDVLIFRKMRPASPSNTSEPATEFEPSQSLPPHDPHPAPQPKSRINPIDGTTPHPYPFVVTGNYASPTGFVNHDLPPWFIPRERLPPPPPPPKPDPSKKKSKTRRVVTSAAWVAGLAYAVGWVAEHWKDL